MRIEEHIMRFLFFILCSGTLFLNAHSFVDTQTASKWYCFIFCGSALIVYYIICSFIPKSHKIELSRLIPSFCFIIVSLCVVQASYGILQYIDILPAFNGHKVTGSFDNPAGFSACLCAGFPFLFYFIKEKQLWKRCLSIASAVILTSAVILSGSRAGIVTLFMVLIAISFYQIRINLKLKMLIVATLFSILLTGLYFLKKDSADGRLLIWQCTWNMIKDKPWTGHGPEGFKAHYMDYQASYFEHNPDSQYVMLADNVNRPFNEYLRLLVNYGFVGFSVFLIITYFLWRLASKNRENPLSRIAGWCLISILTFSIFSYPLKYPFVWVMGILSIVIIILTSRTITLPAKINISLKLAIIPVFLVTCVLSYNQMQAEILWYKIAHKSLAGKTKQVLPVYEKLKKTLKYNELFLYNYAAELNMASEYDKSLTVAFECRQLLSDYDLQILIADNYRKKELFQDAEHHYLKASHMCPVRFIPLYRLYKLHVASGNNDQALKLAYEIYEKPVKIMSPAIKQIKYEVKRKIDSL